jgi:hypothetical protein
MPNLPNTVSQYLRHIARIADLPSFASTVAIGMDGHGAAYNFDNLSVHSGRGTRPPTKTIEFRQYRGTLNGREVVPWVEFVLSMIRFAETRDTSLEEYLDSCMTHMQDPRFGAKALFQLLNLPQHARDYFLDVLEDDLHEIEGEVSMFRAFMEAIVTRRSEDSRQDRVRAKILERIRRGLMGNIEVGDVAEFGKELSRSWV